MTKLLFSYCDLRLLSVQTRYGSGRTTAYSVIWNLGISQSDCRAQRQSDMPVRRCGDGHHQDRTSQHEHGDTGHVQQRSAHATSGGRLEPGISTRSLAKPFEFVKVTVGTVSLLVFGLNLNRRGRQPCCSPSLGFGKDILASVETDNVELTFPSSEREVISV